MTDTTTIFWIGLTLGCFIGGIIGFVVCAMLTIGGDDDDA